MCRGANHLALQDPEVCDSFDDGGRVCRVGRCSEGGTVFEAGVALYVAEGWYDIPCIPVFEDNEGAIQIAKNPVSNTNSKHIDVRHHFLRELVERKEIDIIHVVSQDQHADFLTKALPESSFAIHRDFVMNLK